MSIAVFIPYFHKHNSQTGHINDNFDINSANYNSQPFWLTKTVRRLDPRTSMSPSNTTFHI